MPSNNQTKTPRFYWGVFLNLEFVLLVRTRGLEPPRVASLVPETSASTNSATSARIEHGHYSVKWQLTLLIYWVILKGYRLFKVRALAAIL